MNKEKNCTCDEDCNNTEDKKNKNCKCGEHNHEQNHQCHCHDDGECDCGDDCHCHEHDGECDCGDDCHCHEHDGECDCGDDCHCHEHDGECDCGEVHPKTQEEAFAMYEKAFRQLEDALIKADKELQKEKQRADENEHIARVYHSDLERFKERHKNAEREQIEKANEDTALKLLPVVDNFDQALAVAIDPSVKKGFEMIYKNLIGIIGDLGVEEIEALGADFDPELHECVIKVKADNGKKSGKVSRVFKAGYKLKGEGGKVIRHSMVEIYE